MRRSRRRGLALSAVPSTLRRGWPKMSCCLVSRGWWAVGGPRPEAEVNRASASGWQPALLRQLLQRGLRPRADMLDHFSGGKRSQSPGFLIAQPTDQPEQKSGGEQVARASGVDQFVN